MLRWVYVYFNIGTWEFGVQTSRKGIDYCWKYIFKDEYLILKTEKKKYIICTK